MCSVSSCSSLQFWVSIAFHALGLLALVLLLRWCARNGSDDY
jgi:hypothetical protein